MKITMNSVQNIVYKVCHDAVLCMDDHLRLPTLSPALLYCTPPQVFRLGPSKNYLFLPLCSHGSIWQPISNLVSEGDLYMFWYW